MLTQAISLKIVDSIITKRDFKGDSTHKCDLFNFILKKAWMIFKYSRYCSEMLSSELTLLMK